MDYRFLFFLCFLSVAQAYLRGQPPYDNKAVDVHRKRRAAVAAPPLPAQPPLKDAVTPPKDPFRTYRNEIEMRRRILKARRAQRQHKKDDSAVLHGSAVKATRSVDASNEGEIPSAAEHSGRLPATPSDIIERRRKLSAARNPRRRVKQHHPMPSRRQMMGASTTSKHRPSSDQKLKLPWQERILSNADRKTLRRSP